MESTRIIAESLSNNTAEFTRRMDGMDENLAAIKHLLEQSNASSSKLANEVQSLSTQAVSHHDKLHRQGQAAFHRVQEVENLVADFKSTSATIIDALDKSVPKYIKSAIMQTLPPTLQTVLGETIPYAPRCT
jgi:predicted  nucleic acid-binding Zn-ribbon protein